MKYFTIFFELFIRFLEWLASLLDSKKHRLKGGFMLARKVLSSEHTGFNINGKSITPKLSMQGVLVNGETGSFKTAGVIVRSILTVKGSQIIHDPSGELHEKTSGALHEKGCNILQLNFANPKGSLRFNLMERVSTKSEITQLATNLVMIQSGEQQAEDSFWNQKAIEVLYLFISILKTQEKQYQNLYNVAYLLDVMQSKDSRKYIDRLFASCSSDELFSKYTSICSQSDNTLSSILSTAQVSIQLFSLDENIAEITSSDTLGDFNNILRHQKTALYIHSSTSKVRYFSKVTSIFLSQYFDNFFEVLPDKDMLDVYFHLDEAPVLSINSLDVICANIRKYRGAIMCVTQNAQAQLTARYGKRADAIISNLRTKVYLSADLPTAQALEQTIGRYEFIDKQDKRSMKTRPVITADEIMALPSDKVLVMVSGMRAILTKLTPYFKVKKLNDLAQLPPVDYTPAVTKHRDIPLLPIKTLFPDTDEV